MKRILMATALTIALGGCGGSSDDQTASRENPPRPGDNSGGVQPGTTVPTVPANQKPAQPTPPGLDGNSATPVQPPVAPRDDARPPKSGNDEEESRGDDDPSVSEKEGETGDGESSELVAAFTTMNASATVGLNAGDLIPEITGRDVEGSEFRLSDYEGKVIMLDFWGDW